MSSRHRGINRELSRNYHTILVNNTVVHIVITYTLGIHIEILVQSRVIMENRNFRFFILTLIHLTHDSTPSIPRKLPVIRLKARSNA